MTLNLIVSRLDLLDASHSRIRKSFGSRPASSNIRKEVATAANTRSSIFYQSATSSATPQRRISCKRFSTTRHPSLIDRCSVRHELCPMSKEVLKVQEVSSITLNLGSCRNKQYRSQKDTAKANESIMDFFVRYKEILRPAASSGGVKRITKLKKELAAVEETAPKDALFLTKPNLQAPENLATSIKFTCLNVEHIIRIRQRLLDRNLQPEHPNATSCNVRITFFSTDVMCRKMIQAKQRTQEVSIRRFIAEAIEQARKETAEKMFWCFAESEKSVLVNEFYTVDEAQEDLSEQCEKMLRLILFCVLLEPERRVDLCRHDVDRILKDRQGASSIVKQHVKKVLQSLQGLNFRINTAFESRKLTVQDIVEFSGFK